MTPSIFVRNWDINLKKKNGRVKQYQGLPRRILRGWKVHFPIRIFFSQKTKKTRGMGKCTFYGWKVIHMSRNHDVTPWFHVRDAYGEVQTGGQSLRNGDTPRTPISGTQTQQSAAPDASARSDANANMLTRTVYYDYIPPKNYTEIYNIHTHLLLF